MGMLGLAGVTAMETSVGVDPPPPPPPPPQEFRKNAVEKKKIINKLIIFALVFLFPMTFPL